MNYKDTLNLPKTAFSMKANLPSREPNFLKLWSEKDIYGLMRKKREGKEKYILHDGPPYANGHIHMGHVLNKILKDIVIKYMTLRGYDSPYVPGWDCHGLPVEHQLLKELKIGKGGINQVEFREKARDYAMEFVGIQREEFKRLGIFGNWKNPYLTLSHVYEAEIIRSFAKLVEEGYIYKDLKPVNWCTTCETALAEAEVEYEDHTSPSVYVKFKIAEFKKELPVEGLENASFVIWTTTPWTLLANVAIAVHPELRYAIIDAEGEKWILLASLVEATMEKAGKKHTVLSTVKGRDLEGSLAIHPFIDRKSIVVSADYVSSEEGTGCVHTAPGHGQEDYLTGKKYNLDLIMPVDAKGNFDNTCGEFSGMNVHQANKKIIERMKKDGSLIFSEGIQHSYPHCWRCKAPIIFRATEQWFLKVDHKNLRKRLLEAIEKDVKWYPDIGMSRIMAMVENRPDWCLSRQRYWGVPIPAFYCKGCKTNILDHKIILDLAGLVDKEGVDVWFKKEASELLPKDFKCPHCGASDIVKENDILDVWFESGVSHQAVLKTDKSLEYPCGLYLEGSDQHRGWFQSSIITAMAIDGKAPYGAVLTHGFIVDGNGKKMSKSLGNVISPEDIMKQYGADILRLWVSSSNYSDDVRISDEIIKGTADAYRKIRNTFRYLMSNLYDFDPTKDMTDVKDMEDIDRWMLSKLGSIVKETAEYYSRFLFHKVYRSIYNFCVYEVSSVYLDILKDTLYTFKKDSRKRRSAQSVIYLILDCLTRILSPILSFTTEEVWQEMVILREGESVHLSDWPDKKYDINSWIDEERDKKWMDIIVIREAVQKALEKKRMEGVIGSPLDAKVLISSKDEKIKKLIKDDIGNLPMYFIVSQVEMPESMSDDADYYEEARGSVSIKKAEGKKCQRCWNYSFSVGKDKDHPDICEKCISNIG